jgi:hypothetical protein
MKAQQRCSRLLAVWLLLAILVILIVIIELINPLESRLRGDGHTPGNAAVRNLLPVPVDQLDAIELSLAGTVHRFERDAAGAWFYHANHPRSEVSHAHDSDSNLAARIAEVFAAFGRTQIERRFTLKAQADDYGVAKPKLLILVYAANDKQPLAQYVIGDIAPDTLSRYVQIVGRSVIATIPNYQIDNLLTLVEMVMGKSKNAP